MITNLAAFDAKKAKTCKFDHTKQDSKGLIMAYRVPSLSPPRRHDLYQHKIPPIPFRSSVYHLQKLDHHRYRIR